MSTTIKKYHARLHDFFHLLQCCHFLDNMGGILFYCFASFNVRECNLIKFKGGGEGGGGGWQVLSL